MSKLKNPPANTFKTLQLNSGDNVAVALVNLTKEDLAVAPNINARERIARGHKIALQPIHAGDSIIKYGQVIGTASKAIAAGEHVHLHNVVMSKNKQDYAFGSLAQPVEMVPETERATFQGYRRQDGRVGTRNYIGIVTSVNCAATAARLIAHEAKKRGLLAAFPNVDGIVPIVHGIGCCVGTQDESFRMSQRTIWGYARHPNFACVLMLGLGCETNQIPRMVEAFGKPSTQEFHYTTIQQEGGTRKTVEEGIAWLQKALPYTNSLRRQSIPVAELTVALQCGGSDGYSGITANPALGVAVDTLVRQGGTAVLAETSEIYGAEHLLTKRAASRDVGEKLIALIRWWEDYAKKHNSNLNNNPTVGNKAGGLTTILEKSLGAVAKGGTTNLNGVYKYAEPITSKGFVFMDSPGYDPCSITGEVASGSNLICFTTGRGSCYGNKPVPSIKIASNTPMYEHMIEDMDINCGVIAEGLNSVEEMGARIFASILEVASGKQTQAEALDVGDAEFVPWQTGAQL